MGKKKSTDKEKGRGKKNYEKEKGKKKTRERDIVNMSTRLYRHIVGMHSLYI